MPDLPVLFFAQAREMVNAKQLTISLPAQPAPTVHSVVDAVMSLHPTLKALLPSLMIALNLQYVAVDSEQPVTEKDEIAFIPPLSGG